MYKNCEMQMLFITNAKQTIFFPITINVYHDTLRVIVVLILVCMSFQNSCYCCFYKQLVSQYIVTAAFENLIKISEPCTCKL